MCVGVSLWLVGVVSVRQAEACYTDTTDSHFITIYYLQPYMAYGVFVVFFFRT